MKVVISGSRSIKVLPQEAKDRIDRIIQLKAQILVGDAPGVDTLVQDYLVTCLYENVLVCYAKDKPRNNAGKFPVERGGDTYTERDEYMCKNSDYGLAIFDGVSKGTKANIDRMPGKTRVVLVEA